MLWKFSRLRLSDAPKYAVAAAISAAVAIAATGQRDTRVLAAPIGITTYPNGAAMVQVPYRHDGDTGTVSVAIGRQSVVNAMPAHAVKYQNDNYFFRPPGVLDGVVGVSVSVSVSYDYGMTVETLDTRVKVTRVQANGSAKTPDESAPVAAAEAAVALAKFHNADGKLPAYPSTIVDELKDDMRWSSASGVTPEHFMSGLDLWARKKGLPFHSEKITGKTFAILDAFSQALAGGGTAQANIVFKRSGRVTGGTMVNVVRIVRVGQDAFIGVHDSAGPTGTDMYRVRDGALVDYAFSTDTAVIGWGFIQIWDD